MSSLEKVSPGIKPLFFSQKIDAKEPEKKIPSTAANATTRSPVKRQIDINHKNILGLILRSCDTSSKQSSKEEWRSFYGSMLHLILKIIIVEVSSY